MTDPFMQEKYIEMFGTEEQKEEYRKRREFLDKWMHQYIPLFKNYKDNLFDRILIKDE